jgi:phosphoribosylformylglycinamidine synthase
MAFAGGVGADVTDLKTLAPELSDTARLFSESPTRFILEVKPEHAGTLGQTFDGLPLAKVGLTVKEPRLRIAGESGEWLIWSKLDELKEAWQKPLRR